MGRTANPRSFSALENFALPQQSSTHKHSEMETPLLIWRHFKGTIRTSDSDKTVFGLLQPVSLHGVSARIEAGITIEDTEPVNGKILEVLDELIAKSAVVASHMVQLCIECSPPQTAPVERVFPQRWKPREQRRPITIEFSLHPEGLLK